MTIKRVKAVWHHQAPHDMYIKRHRDALASSYFSASMIALMIAGVVMLLGLAAISDSVESYFEEQPVINIVIPPQDLR